jgi:pilus assembly protein Flp/PilA
MRDKLMKIYVAMLMFRQENGQDLVEYALVIALIALAATAGMSTLAQDINNSFSNIGSVMTTYAS